MRGICYSTTLHQREIKFQIFTSENFVLAGRMCSDCVHCVLASIIDVYYVWNVSAKSKQCLFYGNQLRLIVYNDAAIMTDSFELISSRIKELANDGSGVRFANNFSHYGQHGISGNRR